MPLFPAQFSKHKILKTNRFRGDKPVIDYLDVDLHVEKRINPIKIRLFS
jgi:hypothetical protein